jgi:hypothetical protein
LGAVVPGAFLYALVLLIDPYDSVPFSPNWQRYPVRGDHRHWNAMLVRKPDFDSAVLGTSSSMLLKPAELNDAIGGRFVNLSMPAATPFEQLRLLQLFRHYRGPIDNIIVGVDSLWCRPDGGQRFTNEVLRKAFPEWLYDTDPWNDLPPFNKTTLKAAYDQARAMLGTFTPYERWPDGYEDLTKTLHKKNDRESIRKRIYEGPRDGRLWRKPQHTSEPVFPDLDALGDELAQLPASTLKILFFSPFHHFHQPAAGSEQEALWNGCKHKAAALAGRIDGLIVVDFLLRSHITQDDGHYIDGYHYTTTIATELTRDLAEAVRGRDDPRGAFRILARSQRPAAAWSGRPEVVDASVPTAVDGPVR